MCCFFSEQFENMSASTRRESVSLLFLRPSPKRNIKKHRSKSSASTRRKSVFFSFAEKKYQEASLKK